MTQTQFYFIVIGWPLSLLGAAFGARHGSQHTGPAQQTWHIHLPDTMAARPVQPEPGDESRRTIQSTLNALADQGPRSRALESERDRLSDALVGLAFRSLLHRTLAHESDPRPLERETPLRDRLNPQGLLPDNASELLDSTVRKELMAGDGLDGLRATLAEQGVSWDLATLLGNPDSLARFSNVLDGFELPALGGGAFSALGGLGGLGGSLSQLQELGQNLSTLGDLGNRLGNGDLLDVFQDRDTTPSGRRRRSLLWAILLNLAPNAPKNEWEDSTTWDRAPHTLY